MKTLLTILMVALFGAIVSANPGSKVDYLITKDGKVVVAKVHFGLFKIHAKTTKGCILEASYKDVVTFHKDGELYSKKPLYNSNKNSGSIVFMKLISWRNGLGLYCYEDPTLGLINNKRYFIFKDENIFWLEVDSRNAETIKRFYNRIM